MRAIPGSIGDFLRLAAMSATALAVAACVPIAAPTLGPGPPPMVTAKTIRTLGAAPVKGAAVTFAFATVTGVPATMRFSLEDSLKRYAATRNLTILSEGDPAAVYKVKGYLSAIGDTTGTLLVYVWDVSDPAGTPLFRVSGQETAAGSGSDPWVGISTAEMDAAARETIDKLADWARS